MKGQLNQLIHLQEIDTQLIQITAKKSDQPRKLEEARRPVQDTQKSLEQTRSKVEGASKKKREKEQDLQAQEGQVEKLKSRQAQIKTNKEYHALLQELESAKEAIGRLEEALLLLMEELDNQGKVLTQHEQSLIEAETAYRSIEGELLEEAKQLDETISKLEAERNEAIGQLDAKLRQKYEQIKQVSKNIVVVPIINGSCGGCHTNLPPQLVAEVKLEAELLSCSYCHRILYWKVPTDKADNPTAASSVPT